MLMLSPYSRKAVDVPDGLVDRFREAGFNEKEPEDVAPVRVAAPAPRKRGRPPKTTG